MVECDLLDNITKKKYATILVRLIGENCYDSGMMFCFDNKLIAVYKWDNRYFAFIEKIEYERVTA